MIYSYAFKIIVERNENENFDNFDLNSFNRMAT